MDCVNADLIGGYVLDPSMYIRVHGWLLRYPSSLSDSISIDIKCEFQKVIMFELPTHPLHILIARVVNYFVFRQVHRKGQCKYTNCV